MKIETRDLKKYFGKTKAVDGISFVFGSGDVVGLVGPNGSGKTTMMRIMATLEEQTSGDVFIDGVSVSEYPDRARQVMGFVPDALPEYEDVTVHEYLDFFGRAYGMMGKELESAVDEVEEFTGLKKMRETLLKALSKGMKQRVSVGRSLIHNPEFLILDEPAAGLDPGARVELRQLLSILAQQKKAIFLSSHILAELTEICNRFIIIDDGKALDEGTLSELAGRKLPRKGLVIKTINRIAEICKCLLEMPGVCEAREDGGAILAEVEGTDETCSTILANLIGDGFKISEFRQKGHSLEDIFITATKNKQKNNQK